MSNTPEWLIEGLKTIANGLPTRAAASLAGEMLAQLDTAFHPIMKAPKVLDYAIDMPEPWQPVPVSTTGERIYKNPDGRLAVGISYQTYGEFMNTRFMPLAHSMVHAGGFLYMEADSEERLLEQVKSFDINYKELVAERNVKPAVKRIGRRKS